jgi:hypothetical protein
LWNIEEESSEMLSEVDDSTDKRDESRHTIPTEVVIEVFGDDDTSPQTESTVTENISRSGAAVFTSMNLERGRFLRMSTRDGLTVMAAVRNRSIGPDGIARLHLQFIGGEWPL